MKNLFEWIKVFNLVLNVNPYRLVPTPEQTAAAAKARAAAETKAANARAAEEQARLIAAEEEEKARLVAEEQARLIAEEQAKAAADAKAAVRSRNIRDAKIIGGTVVGTTAVVGGIGIPLAIQEGKRRGRNEGPVNVIQAA